jgi:hypothetical protein
VRRNWRNWRIWRTDGGQPAHRRRMYGTNGGPLAARLRAAIGQSRHIGPFIPRDSLIRHIRPTHPTFPDEAKVGL